MVKAVKQKLQKGTKSKRADKSEFEPFAFGA